jgi:hypothetical protein
MRADMPASIEMRDYIGDVTALQRREHGTIGIVAIVIGVVYHVACYCMLFVVGS